MIKVHSCHDDLPTQNIAVGTNVLCCTFGQDYYSGHNLKSPTAKESSICNRSCGEDHGRYTCCEACIQYVPHISRQRRDTNCSVFTPRSLSASVQCTACKGIRVEWSGQLVPAEPLCRIANTEGGGGGGVQVCRLLH